MKPAAAAIRRKAAASTKKPGQALPSKTSSASSQAMPSMTRIRARKAKTPAAIPTTEPRRILPTFSEISVLASSISSRTSEELFSATSKTSSETERSSWVGRCGTSLPGGGVPVPSATLLGRILVVDAAEDDGGEARRGDAGERTAGGQHAAPDETLGDVVIHGARPYLSGLETVADRRHQQGLCLVEIAVGGRDHLEDPARKQLLDRAVEGHRGEGGVDVAAKDAGLLAVGDDLGDRVISAADLPQVGAAEGVGR